MSAVWVALLLAQAPPQVLALGAANSRAAYQAGVAYALVRGAEAPLAGVAGVSGGSLNAVLAALEQCRRPREAASPEASPLWAAWRGMSWERLFPGDRRCADYAAEFGADGVDCARGLFGAGDALMTVAGLGELRRSLLALIGSSEDYAPDCRVPVALSVAAETPARFRIGEQAIETARRMVMMELRTVGTPPSLALCAIRTSSAARGGTVIIELPQLGAPDVARAGQVLDALELIAPDLRAAGEEARGAREPRVRRVLERLERDLAPGMNALEARVAALRAGVPTVPGPPLDAAGLAALDARIAALDAEVDATCRRIDPLRLVELLTVSTAPVLLQESRLVTYCGVDCSPIRQDGEWCPIGTQLCADRLYDGAILDPQPIAAAAELRAARPLQIVVAQLSSTDDPPTPEGPVGLAFYKRLVDGVVAVAQSYELQTLARYGQLDGVGFARRVRTATITGDLLYGMGAFVDQRFRRFDFHAGIVDTVLAGEANCAARRARAARLGVRAVPELWALFSRRMAAAGCPPDPFELKALRMAPASVRTTQRIAAALDTLPGGSSERRFATFVEALQADAPVGEPETHPAITHFRPWWIEQIRGGLARLEAWEPTLDRPLVAAEALVALSQRDVHGWVFGSPRIVSRSVGAVAAEVLVPRSLSLVALGEEGFALRWVYLSAGTFVWGDDTLSLELGGQSFVRRALGEPTVVRYGPSLALALSLDDVFGRGRDRPRVDSLVLDAWPTEVGVRGHWQPSLRGEEEGALHFGWDAYLQLLDGYVEVTVSALDRAAPNRVSLGLAQVDALLYWLARVALGE